jgi:hypothetical protein
MGGAMHRQDFLGNWSSVKYCNHTAAKQDVFDRIFKRADHLVVNATSPSGAGELEEDEGVTWEQIQVLIQGVFDLAAELDEAGFKYKAQNKKHPQLDTGWYPTSTCTTRWRTRGMP